VVLKLQRIHGLLVRVGKKEGEEKWQGPRICQCGGGPIREIGTMFEKRKEKRPCKVVDRWSKAPVEE